MLFTELFEFEDFVAKTQGASYLDLVMKCLTGSARAITKYLDTPPEQLRRLQIAASKLARSGDEFAMGDLRDIADALVTDGHANSINDIRNVGVLFNTADRVIREKRGSLS